MKTRGKLLKNLLLLLMCLFILTPNNVFAAESDPEEITNEDIIIDLDNEFKTVFEESTALEVTAITDDEHAYSVLLNNKEYVTTNPDKTINVNINEIILNNTLSDEDATLLTDFVNRINNLIVLEAIVVDSNFLISFDDEIEPVFTMQPRATVINIMSTTRSHKNTLKSVFNNAIFSTRHAVAGAYFAQRVKPGGTWDYKKTLGLNTYYTIGDLGSTMMTGESVGNFHYGYVGRAVFSATTLKSAAGMVQIAAGTSSMSFWKSYFDDPRDQAQIQRGIDKYNSEH